MKKNGLLLIFLCCFFCLGCTNKTVFGKDSLSIQINRFDVDLYKYLQNECSEESLSQKNELFLDVFGKSVLSVDSKDSVGYFDRLKSFFSEPTLMALYKKEQEIFSDITTYEQELSAGFEYLKEQFPLLNLPHIYMHVSGLNQNIIVTDSILSLSADKYLGKDYSLYQDFFYEYQLRKMSPERIVPDYLLGFMYSEFAFEGNENTLLSHILYEGKLRYILSLALPERKTCEAFGYTEEQYDWCMQSESRIWKTILQQKQLYTTDYLTISQYISDAPYTAPLTSSSPGRVGVWVGYRIIESYMKHHPKTTIQELIDLVDSQRLLKNSKYS